jgi:hypothetical protein
VLTLALGLSLASCDGDDDANLASMAPPDAPLYAEIAIDPGSDQADALASLTERVAGIDDPVGALVSELDAALAVGGSELSFEEDIEPWLGDRAALFARTFEPTGLPRGVPDFAAMVEVDDGDAALSFLGQALAADPGTEEERSYEGHDYFFTPDDGGVATGLIEDSLVFGTEASFMVAVDALEGESLAESPEYRERTEALAADRLATVFVQPGAAIEAAIAGGDLHRPERRLLQPLLAGPLATSVAAGLTLSDAAASVDLVAMVADDDLETDGPMIESLPAGSWLAAASPQLGSMLGHVLDQVEHGGLPGAGTLRQRLRRETGIDPRTDVLAWLRGAAVFVEGTAVPGFRAGIIAQTTDPDGPRRLLGRARVLAERESGLGSSGPPDGADYGFSLGLPGIGGGAEAAVVGDQLVAVLGGTIAEALEPDATLGSDERFTAATAALGDDFAPGLYVDLPSFFAVAEQGGSGDDPDYRAAAPYLEALASLLAGTRVEGDQVVSRWTLALADE